MIDNLHVVVLNGTGRDMVPTAEMAGFADRCGFKFRTHEKVTPTGPAGWNDRLTTFRAISWVSASKFKE